MHYLHYLHYLHYPHYPHYLIHYILHYLHYLQVALDLLPEDINCIMSQSTTPYCPICTKDCANFPNLRSHLQVYI